MVLALSLIFATSCTKEKDTADLSRTTFFADFTLEGDGTIFLPCGTAYTEPGVKAEENGTAVEVTTTMASGLYFGEAGVGEDVADIYAISYSAINSDGFPGTASRTVIVSCNGDLGNNEIEGLYTATIVRVTGETHSNLEYVIIHKTGDNEYKLSSAIGGFYENGRGFGPGYAAEGANISFDGTSFAATTATFPLWGNIIDIMGLTLDAASKTISYHATGDFGSAEFDVVLTQVN